MNDRPVSKYTFFHGTIESAPYVPGRREFFRYRDFNIDKSTHGAMRVQMIEASAPMDRETGWHYHTADIQFNFMLEGWSDLQLEDGTEIRLRAGECLFIPGGMRHNELRTSDNVRTLEVIVPGQMDTVAVDVPEPWKGRKSKLLEA